MSVSLSYDDHDNHDNHDAYNDHLDHDDHLDYDARCCDIMNDSVRSVTYVGIELLGQLKRSIGLKMIAEPGAVFISDDLVSLCYLWLLKRW